MKLKMKENTKCMYNTILATKTKVVTYITTVIPCILVNVIAFPYFMYKII